MNKLNSLYERFLNRVAKEYKGRTFHYVHQTSGLEENLTLFGTAFLTLEFRDSQNRSTYLGIQDFLQAEPVDSK